MSKLDIPVYLINLDRSPLRLASAQSQLNKYKIEFERIRAVDGQGLEAADFEEYNDFNAKKYYGRSMTSGEIGCYFSHVKALNTFLKSNERHCIILEDDFHATASGWEIVCEIIELSLHGHLGLWDIGNLTKPPRFLFKPIVEIATENTSSTLCKAYYFPTVATANIWNRKGAENFLAHYNNPIGPVDHIIRKYVSKNGSGIALSAPAFAHPKGESDIRSASPLWQKPAKIGHYRCREIVRQSSCIVSAAFNFANHSNTNTVS